jgi:hypothetical protein
MPKVIEALRTKKILSGRHERMKIRNIVFFFWCVPVFVFS